MAAGFKYNLVSKDTNEEVYDVSTGVNRIGAYVLDTTGMPENMPLPFFAPVYADLKNKKAYMVRNMKVVAAVAATDTVIDIAKGSMAVTGMFVGNGSKGGKITAIDASKADYDAITIDAAFGAALSVGDVLFEASAAGGTKQKYIANSALYGNNSQFHSNLHVEKGINIVSLLRHAAEIEPDKLVIPFSQNDKDNLQGLFEFNE